MNEDSIRTDPGASWVPDDGVRDDADADGSHASFSPEDDPVVTIVELVASDTGREVTAMPPLFDAIDPEALTQLLTDPRPRDRPIVVTFAYQNRLVTVSSDGEVAVETPTE